jgi:hypothetical protein
MRRLVVLVLVVVGCDAPVSHVAAAPVASSPSTAERGDTCQHDIPDCEAACALREVHRVDHIDWFDRRCAAVVLGKNPDKAVGYVAPEPELDASIEAAPPPREPVSCDPPYSLGSDGHKIWKRECFR